MTEIRMGAVAPKLSEQISGLPEHFDRDAEAITRLKIRGLLTVAEGGVLIQSDLSFMKGYKVKDTVVSRADENQKELFGAE